MIVIIKILVLLFVPDFSLRELLHARTLRVYKVDFVRLSVTMIYAISELTWWM